MEMIVLDWTRMGKTYCVAGLVAEGDGWRSVRPLPSGGSTVVPSPVRNTGWFPRQLELLRRWDIVQLMDPKPLALERPHTEDLTVRLMRMTGRTVPIGCRGSVLRSTVTGGEEPLFGAPLLLTKTSAYLMPGTGERSLATIVVDRSGLKFEASAREGSETVDIRVRLPVPGAGERLLPVKDHELLTGAERAAGSEPRQIVACLAREAARMSRSVAIRLGLSRGYGAGESRCWLMADGFFSVEDNSH